MQRVRFSPRTSRRARRRIGLASVTVAAAGAVTLAVLLGHTADPPLHRSTGPAQLEQRPSPAKLSTGDRREILATAHLFVATAVRRERPVRAWAIASSTLRAGQKLAAWKAGSMPVVPYPVRDARTSFAYAHRGEVGLDVWVDSRDPELSALVFRLTLVPERGSWLVDSWTPLPSADVFSVTPYRTASASPSGEGFERASSKSSPLWIAAPFVVLLLALLAPATAAVAAAWRRRRSRAAWPVASGWPSHDRSLPARLPRG